MFRAMAREFAGESALYERMSTIIADQPELATPLLVAPKGQRRALLLLASIQQVLRVTEARHALAAWYPSLGGTRSPEDPKLAAALADLIGRHREHITTMCATRTTQTNEVRRAALVRPALGFAARRVDQPLALIELGASAGLLLVPDRYAFRYVNADRDETYGTGYRIDCRVRSGWPDPAAEPLRIASRVGLDLAPVRPDDEDRVNWLRSCIWPEHVDRVARLDAALAVVAATRPPMIAGNFVDTLPGVLRNVGPDQVPCVFTSHALAYLRSTERASLLRLWDSVGQTRDLVVIVNENPVVGVNAFDPAPRFDSDLKTPVTVVVWRRGKPTVTVLALGAPHGNYLHYQPRECVYAPPLLAT